MLKILIVEDDVVHASFLEEFFQAEYEDLEVMLITSERQFKEDFDEIKYFRPNVIILDIMLRWSNALTEAPNEPTAENMFRAGFRCLKAIDESPELKNHPVVIHSVLSKDSLRHELIEELGEIPKNVFFLDKTSLITDLLRLVQSLVTEAHPKLRKSSTLSRLVESSDLRPGWFGISLDLKRLFKRK